MLFRKEEEETKSEIAFFLKKHSGLVLKESIYTKKPLHKVL
jgi:hypothetical protein